MIQNRKHLPFKNNAISFSKYRPSFYKLTNKQIKQLIKYLMNPSIQEELNFALKHMSICPYCASEDFYKTKNKSSIYQWKCESCHKSFNILHKSPLSCILPNYSTKYYQRDIKKTLQNTEVWLHFKIKHDRQYKIIPRKDIISTSFRWKHHIIQIPKDLKKDHLNNIRKYNKEAFNNLINLGTNNQYKDKSNKKYIVLTFEEGKFIPKKYFVGIPDQPSHSSSHILENYILANTKKKCQQEYERLKNILINSYNDKCETINMPQKNDSIYTNIKIPYKHTYTLAYAMAIRNKEVKKILFILKYLKNVSRDILAHKTSMITNYSNFLSHELHKQYLSLGIPNINNMLNFRT